MKKVLLAGYYGHDNLGDEAIAEAKNARLVPYEQIMHKKVKVLR